MKCCIIDKREGRIAVIYTEEECEVSEVSVELKPTKASRNVQRACGVLQPAVRIVPYVECRHTEESGHWWTESGSDRYDQLYGSAEPGYDPIADCLVDGFVRRCSVRVRVVGTEPGESTEHPRAGGNSPQLSKGLNFQRKCYNDVEQQQQHYQEDWTQLTAPIAANHPLDADRAEQLEQKADHVELLLSTLQVSG